MANEIWLIRHGATAWSVTGQHTGRTDLPLTEAGEAEAERTRAALQGERFDTVLCSPLQRARRTCEICGFLAQARIEPDCMEWDYGELNGITRVAYQQAHPGWTLWRDGTPGGERVEDVAVRAARVLHSLQAVEGRAAIFAHGHFLRILTSVYLGLEPSAARHFALATARLSILGLDNAYPAILAWNR